MQHTVIDVSTLEPPQPMTQIIKALTELKENYYLKVLHRRQPFPLYVKLIESGWYYYCQCHSESNVTIYIYRQCNEEHFAQLKMLGKL